MQIQIIRIKNINSLQGEVEINLTQSPLSDTGLFAITGDTGAGKSTILDAITLALYGRIPRNKEVKEVLSYGATECYAEVDFLEKDSIYRAKWSLWRARGKVNGNILGPNRELAKQDVETGDFLYIASKNREVDQKVEQITGLDFNRFTRSVLLSQGDFAAFLKANEKDRSDLLERITGTEIYSELSKAAYQKNKEEQEALEHLQVQKDALQLLDEEDITNLETTNQALIQESNNTQLAIQTIQTQLHQWQQKEALEQRLIQLEKEQTNLNTEKEQAQDSFLQLENHLKILPFIDRLQQLDEQEGKLNLLETTITNTHTTLAQNQEELSVQNDLLTDKKQKHQETKKEHEKLLELCVQVDKLDTSLEEKRQPIHNLQKKVEDIGQKLKDHLDKKEKLTLQEEELSKKQTNLSKWLTTNTSYEQYFAKAPKIDGFRDQLRDQFIEQRELNKNITALTEELEQQSNLLKRKTKDLEGIQTREEELVHQFKTSAPEEYVLDRTELLEKLNQDLQAIHQEFNYLEQLKTQTQSYSQLLLKQAALQDQAGHLAQEELHLGMQLLSAYELLGEKSKIVEYKKNILEQQQLIANYERDRQLLKEDEACPLCFSTTHPFREMTLTPFVNEAQQELTIIEEQYNSIKLDYEAKFTRYNEVSSRLVYLNGDLANELPGELEKIDTQITNLESQIAQFAPQIQSEYYQITKHQYLTKKVADFEEQMKQKKATREDLMVLDKTLEQVEQQKIGIEKTCTELTYTIANLEEKIAGLNAEQEKKISRFSKLTEKLNLALNHFQLNFSSIETAKQTFDTFHQIGTEFQNKKEQLESVSQQITLTQKDLEFVLKQEKEEDFVLEKEKEWLTELETGFQNLQEQRIQLFGEKQTEIEREKMQLQVQKTAEELEQTEASLNQLQLEKERLSTQIKEQTQQQKQLKKEQSNLSIQLTKSALKAGFDNLSILKEMQLETEEVTRIDQLKKELERKSIELDQSKEDTQQQLDQLATKLQKEENTPDKSSLETELKALQSTFQQLEQDKGKIEQQLSTNESRKKDAKQLLKAIDRQKKICRKWSVLNDIIGQADGQKFRKFAQGLTLSKLAIIANQNLQLLNARYQIHKPNDKDLELHILDTYQANNIRSMNTLSGGESFLVSLALALALSNMAGKQTQIQSLFIDEGFGTLDDQTLDLAITTLENLQAQGKTIGVISHVKELKERISTQIQVKKIGGGVSRVEIVA